MGKKKAQNGRARQKQKAKGGNTPRTPKPNYAQQQMLADSDWDEDTPIHFRGFAQQSPSFTPRSANAAPKLRHTGISFVSAGLNTSSLPQPRDNNGDIALDDSDSEEGEEEDIDDSNLQTNVMEADIEISEQGMANMHIQTSQMEIEDDTATASTSDFNIIGVDKSPVRRPADVTMADSLFMVDTVGDASLSSKSNATRKRPIKRAPSPARSDSSEEVIVFSGRNKPTIVNDPVTRTANPTPTPPARASRAQSPHVTDDLLNALSNTSQPSALPSSGWGSRSTKQPTQPNDAWEPAPETPYWKKGKGRPRPDLGPSAAEIKMLEQSPPKESKVQFAEAKGKEKEKDAEDTIAALQADWKRTLRDKKAMKPVFQEIASTESSKSSKSSKRKGKRGRKKDNRAMRAAITSDDDASDGEAAYDDYMENLRAQLDGADDDDAALLPSLQADSRFPPAMVVDGQEIGDDQLLPTYKKDDGQADATWELNDASDWEDEDEDSEMNPDPDELSSDDTRDMDSSDLEDELEYAEREQWEDEDDLRQRRADRMTDEQIARLLAKQEELGMGSDELILDNGMDISDDGFGDINAARAGLGDLAKYSFGRSAKTHSMRRHRGDRKENFPDASMLADAVDQYGKNGFDIMDFDRPSLRPRKKGRKGQLPEELEMMSDEDLKEELRSQWDNDRGKKALKKAEREELRREGLLGSAGRKGKSDLSQKYPIGMNMRQVHDELRDFLQNDEHRERAFPPMAKIDRKALHEVAMALNLSSNSRGAGKKRFTVVTKTSRTSEYDHGMSSDVINASSRGFLTNAKATRMAKRNARGSTRGGRRGGGGRGGGISAASVRHGELVGAGAAEISSNSFGHRMMEKMGWSKGTALGKDRDGLLVPVEQRMRVGTAGLG